jgi:hypothetical protein
MLLLSSLAFTLLASASPAIKSNLTVALCDAGEHQQFETVTCDIELKNNGDKPVHVSDAHALSRLDSIEQAAVVPAHGSVYLHATVDISDSTGFTHRYFQFATDEPGALASRNAEVQTFASTVLDNSSPLIDFGAVTLDELPSTKTITLTSREVGDFRILGISSKPSYIDASVAADGRSVNISLRKDAPWGIWHERVKLKINAPQQSEARIKVDANVLGDVVPDVNPVLLGLMRTNSRNEFLIRLTSRTSKNFNVGALTLKGIKGSTKVIPCKPASDGCKIVQLVIAKDQPQGRVNGVLSIELPDFKQTLPIELGGGLLLTPDVKIRDMNEEKALQERGQLQSKVDSPTTQKSVDVKQAISQVIQKKAQEQAPPPGNGPLLRWSVAHQIGYYGYIIYRADLETGPSQRVNKDVIRISNDEGSDAGSYQWRDNSAESGKTYWYSIGIVKDDGEKVPLSSAQKVVAK